MPATTAQRPIVLLADSELLFWREGAERFLARVLLASDIAVQHAKAAYIGACNGDAPEFFELFQAACSEIGLSHCMHVHATPSVHERGFLEQADVILLAGGEREGALIVADAGRLAELVRKRHAEGALVMGVSAGAVLLGASVDGPDGRCCSLSLVPYAVGVREEPGWEQLSERVARANGSVIGVGIPKGSGAIVYSDFSVKSVRKTSIEVRMRDGCLHARELLAVEIPAPPERVFLPAWRRDRTIN